MFTTRRATHARSLHQIQRLQNTSDVVEARQSVAAGCPKGSAIASSRRLQPLKPSGTNGVVSNFPREGFDGAVGPSHLRIRYAVIVPQQDRRLNSGGWGGPALVPDLPSCSGLATQEQAGHGTVGVACARIARRCFLCSDLSYELSSWNRPPSRISLARSKHYFGTKGVVTRVASRGRPCCFQTRVSEPATFV